MWSPHVTIELQMDDQHLVLESKCVGLPTCCEHYGDILNTQLSLTIEPQEIRSQFYFNCVVLFWWQEEDMTNEIKLYINCMPSVQLTKAALKLKSSYLRDTFGLTEDSDFNLRMAINFKCAQCNESEVSKKIVKKVLRQALD